METIPEGYAILIEIDTDFDAAGSIATGDDAADREYVQKFHAGEYTAYTVSAVKLTDDGDVAAVRYADGSFGPVVLASLCGVDVEECNADNLYTDMVRIPDEYLRQVAGEVLGEALTAAQGN